METPLTNLNALNFSPHFWWKAMERGILFADSFGKDLSLDTEFRTWITEGIIEHSSLDLYDQSSQGPILTREFGEMVSNDYFYEVIAISKYGHKVRAKNLQQLRSNNAVTEDASLSYSFRVDDLNHYVTLYFMKWLIIGNHFNWVRWQLYYDFIVSKLDEPLKGLYQYMWSVVLGEVNFHDHFFQRVDQYKLFRDKLEEINKEADKVEQLIAKKRNESLDSLDT